MSRTHEDRPGHSLLHRSSAQRASHQRSTARSDGEIEFVSPRSDLFAGGPTLHDIAPATQDAGSFTDDDEPRSRWATIGAGAGLLALVAIGVLAAAPWQSEEAAAPPPVSTTPATPATTTFENTAGAEPTRESMNLPSGPRTPFRNVLTGDALAPADAAQELDAFIVDPARLPGRMVPLTTGMPGAPPVPSDAARPAGGATDGALGGWLELWATPGAGRGNGSWLAVGWTTATAMFAFEDVVRVPLGVPQGESVALVHVDRGGVSTMSYVLDGGTMTLSWFGLDDDAMLSLAKGLSIEDGAPSYPAGWSPGEMVPLLSRPSVGGDLLTSFVYDHTTATAVYELSDGRYVTVATQEAHADHATMRPFVLSPLRNDPLSGPSVTRQVDDRSVVVGELAPERWLNGRRTNMVEWDEGDVTVQITGELPSSELVALVPLVRRGTAGEWWDMSTIARWPEPLGEGGRDRSVLLGFGELPDGDQWYVSLLPSDQRVDVSVMGASSRSGFWFSLELPEGPCASAADVGSTLVVCVRSLGTGAGAAPETMRVSGAWGAHDVQLEQRNPDVRYAVAILDFEEPGPFAVDILTADGRRLPALHVTSASH